MPITHGGVVFTNAAFIAYINNFYNPLSHMQNSKNALLAHKLDLTKIKWGDYQEILSPLGIWPGRSGGSWHVLRDQARLDLSSLPNTQRLTRDDPTPYPTRVDLLDAAVRKCFNSDPPIPMLIDINDKKAGDDNPLLHDIVLDWDYGEDGSPTLLKWTMRCPAIQVLHNRADGHLDVRILL